MLHAVPRAQRWLVVLLLACYPRGALGATREAFTHGAVSAALQPWASPPRRVSEAAMTARLAEVAAYDPKAQSSKRIVGVLLHAGAAWVSTGPLVAVQMHRSPFLRLLRDAAAVAAADPALSAELLLHLGDSQVNRRKEHSLAGRIPVFAFDRWVRPAPAVGQPAYPSRCLKCASRGGAGELRGHPGAELLRAA